MRGGSTCGTRTESCRAFMAGSLAEMQRQYGHLPIAAQQQRLRIHLRYFLLTIGSQVEDADEDDAKTVTWSVAPSALSVTVPTVSAIRPYPMATRLLHSERHSLQQWRESAMKRERWRTQRHASVRCIQAMYRRHRRLDRIRDPATGTVVMSGIANGFHEEELASSSVFVTSSYCKDWRIETGSMEEEEEEKEEVKEEEEEEEPEEQPRRYTQARAVDDRAVDKLKVPTPATGECDTVTAPFQLVVQWLGARDLAVHDRQARRGATATIRTFEYVSAEVFVMRHEAIELARLQVPRKSLVDAMGGGQRGGGGGAASIGWDNEALHMAIDPMEITPDSILEDCVIRIHVWLHERGDGATDGVRRRAGTLTIAMDLLATPLAHQYAMTRWFPLEHGGSGAVPVRGEVRLSVALLMRDRLATNSSQQQQQQQSTNWVPYQPSAPPSRDAEAMAANHHPRQHSQRAVSHREPRSARNTVRPWPIRVQSSDEPQDKSAMMTTKANKPPLSPRKQAQPVAISQQQEQSQLLPRRRNATRIARVEVISPPSSPSSYSSEAGSEVLDAISPIPEKPSRSPRSLTRQHIDSESPRSLVNGIARNKLGQPLRLKQQVQSGKSAANFTEDADAATAATTTTSPLGSSPKKKFLKRKPYKVVFQKLDWSSVPAKTDCSWNLKVNSTNPDPQADPTAPRRTRGETVTASATQPASLVHGQSIGVDRFASLVQDVHHACHVTAQSAALAQMKYRSERHTFANKYASIAHQLATSSSSSSLSSSPSFPSILFLASDASLHSLWKQLRDDDDSGPTYLKHLQMHS